jgi:hypothetical protein
MADIPNRLFDNSEKLKEFEIETSNGFEKENLKSSVLKSSKVLPTGLETI